MRHHPATIIRQILQQTLKHQKWAFKVWRHCEVTRKWWRCCLRSILFFLLVAANVSRKDGKIFFLLKGRLKQNENHVPIFFIAKSIYIYLTDNNCLVHTFGEFCDDSKPPFKLKIKLALLWPLRCDKISTNMDFTHDFNFQNKTWTLEWNRQ